MRILCIFAVLTSAALAQSNAFLDHVANVKNCVYRVETERGVFLGTAFTINTYGDLLTCLHVVRQNGTDADSVYLRSVVGGETPEGMTQVLNVRFSATVKARVPRFDIAVLHVDTARADVQRFAFRGFASSAHLREGEEVALCAFIPDEFSQPKPFVSKGIVSTIRERVFDPAFNGEVALVQLDLTAARGTSGGPVFLTSSGRVVAIQNAGIFQSKEASQTPYPIALGISQILPVLDSLKIPYDVK